MWVNINNYGHSNTNHIHPNCLLSGVFYPSQSKRIVVKSIRNPGHELWYYRLGLRRNKTLK